MRNLILAILIFGIWEVAYSQWSLSSPNIYNSNSGNVGIGLSGPATKLHVVGSITVEAEGGGNTYFYTSQSGATRRFLEVLAGGTAAGVKAGGLVVADNYSFGTPSSNDLVVKGSTGLGTSTPSSTLDVRGHLTLQSPVSIDQYIYTNTDATDKLNYVQLLNSSVTPNASGLMAGGILAAETYSIRPPRGQIIAQHGVAIGLDAMPIGYKLAVSGKIRATEIKVETGWADFVFKPDYRLRSLKDTENFIKTNGHLPEIPSEKEVAENGINLGEMNAKLLQKIEELTLHLIEKDKVLTEILGRLKKVEEQ